MAARGQERMNMQQPPRVAPTGRSVALTTYHVCANAATPEEKKRMPRPCGKKYKAQAKPRNKAIAKKRKPRAKERSNIVPLNLQRMKQKARARRPQQTRSDSTGRFTIRPTSRVVGRRLGSRPGMVPLQTRRGMVPLQTRAVLQTRPGMVPLQTFPAPRR